jgi:hypothetical protein
MQVPAGAQAREGDGAALQWAKLRQKNMAHRFAVISQSANQDALFSLGSQFAWFAQIRSSQLITARSPIR